MTTRFDSSGVASGMTVEGSAVGVTTFITGAGGFVGLALSELLLSRGETVIGFDRQALSSAARATFDALPGRFVMIEGDVCDASALLDAMRTYSPQRLVTLAAITADAARERRTPAAIFAVNVGGVLNAIDAASQCGVRRIVHASSGSVYGASGKQPAPLDEVATPLLPEGLYGISKAAAETAALRLAALHQLDLVVGRLGTCFGPWESDQRADPKTGRAAGSRDTPSAPLQVLQCLADPLGAAPRASALMHKRAILPRASVRDWLYVRDAAAALVALLDKPALPASIYNLSTGFIWSMQDWCEAVKARHADFQWQWAAEMAIPLQADANASRSTPANAQVESVTIDFYAPYDRAVLNIDRLLSDTDFVPRYDLAAAAHDFLDWHARGGMPHRSVE